MKSTDHATVFISKAGCHWRTNSRSSLLWEGTITSAVRSAVVFLVSWCLGIPLPLLVLLGCVKEAIRIILQPKHRDLQLKWLHGETYILLDLLVCRIAVYHIDRSDLLENTPLVKLIRNYTRDPSGVFSISSLY